MSAFLRVVAPVTLEEQVNTLRAAVIALGKSPWTLYDEIVDGLEALGETARDAFASVVDSLSKEDGKMYAQQMYFLAGLVVKQNLPEYYTAEQAYSVGKAALFESHRDLAMSSIDRVLEACQSDDAVERLDALVASANLKREQKAAASAEKAANKVMTADQLFPEVAKFINANGLTALFAHFGWEIQE